MRLNNIYFGKTSEMSGCERTFQDFLSCLSQICFFSDNVLLGRLERPVANRFYVNLSNQSLPWKNQVHIYIKSTLDECRRLIVFSREYIRSQCEIVG